MAKRVRRPNQGSNQLYRCRLAAGIARTGMTEWLGLRASVNYACNLEDAWSLPSPVVRYQIRRVTGIDIGAWDIPAEDARTFIVRPRKASLRPNAAGRTYVTPILPDGDVEEMLAAQPQTGPAVDTVPEVARSADAFLEDLSPELVPEVVPAYDVEAMLAEAARADEAIKVAKVERVLGPFAPRIRTTWDARAIIARQIAALIPADPWAAL
jgi:hypothetical protein